jgi:hypothetical protein
LLFFAKSPPLNLRRVGRWDVLRGGFAVVVNLETHRSNEGNIFCPIMGIENEVRDGLVLLGGWGDRSSGGCGCGRLRLPPPYLSGSLLDHSRPTLGKMEHARDGVASMKYRHERLPSPSRHLTTNGDEVIKPLVLHGVYDGLRDGL